MLIKKLPNEHSILCQIARLSGRESTCNHIMRHIELAAENNHYEILKSEDGTPHGYIIWFKSSKENIILIDKFNDIFSSPKYDYEYNGGSLKFVLDVVHNQTIGSSRGSLTIGEFRAFIKKHKFVFAYRNGLVMYSIKKGRIVKTKSKTINKRQN